MVMSMLYSNTLYAPTAMLVLAVGCMSAMGLITESLSVPPPYAGGPEVVAPDTTSGSKHFYKLTFCPADYTPIISRNMCWRLLDSTETFENAAAKCRKEGSILVEADNEYESNLLSLISYQPGEENAAWMNVRSDGVTYRRATGRPLYLPSDTPPLVHDPKKPCMHTGTLNSMIWETNECNKKKLVVCVHNRICPAGSFQLKYRGSCYRYISKKQSQPQAAAECRSYGASLAWINSASDNEEVAMIRNASGDGKAWIGLVHDPSAKPYSGAWYHWVIDSFVGGSFTQGLGYTNWYYTQPDHSGDNKELCTLMDTKYSYQGGQWSDYPCRYSYESVCRYPPICKLPTIPWGNVSFLGRNQYGYGNEFILHCNRGYQVQGNARFVCDIDPKTGLVGFSQALLPKCLLTPGKCPAGFTMVDQACLGIIYSPANNYTAAEAGCRSQGAKLATLDSITKEATIVVMLWEYTVKYNYTLPPDLYFGFSDSQKEGTWEWTQATNSLYTNWLKTSTPAEPNGGTAQNCALFRGYDGAWLDENCTASHAYVCETYNLLHCQIPKIQNAIVTPEYHLINVHGLAHNVSVACKPGFHLVGNNQLTCSRSAAGFSYFPHYPRCLNSTFQQTNCSYNYTKVDSTCLKFFSFPMLQYTTARKTCQGENGDLATVDTAAKNNWVAKRVKDLAVKLNVSVRSWIGLTDTKDEGNWTWNVASSWYKTTHSLPYNNWRLNQPSGGSTENCAAISSSDDKWESNMCGIRNAYVCEIRIHLPCDPKVPHGKFVLSGKDIGKVQCNKPYLPSHGNVSQCYRLDDGSFAFRPLLATCAVAAGTCAPGYTMVDGECLRLYASPALDYKAAEAKCHSDNGKLATLDSQDKVIVVGGWLRQQTTKNLTAYFGYSDSLKEGTWQWNVQTDSHYNNWFKNSTVTEPSGGPHENCALLRGSDGKWFDENCTEKHAFVCEKFNLLHCAVPLIKDAVITVLFQYHNSHGLAHNISFACKPGTNLVGKSQSTCIKSPAGFNYFPHTPLCFNKAVRRSDCPQNYTKVDGTCFKFYNSPIINYTDARLTCQGENGDLVTVDTAAKDAWVMAQLQNLKKRTGASESLSSWIGFSDSFQEKDWKWVAKSTWYTKPGTFVNFSHVNWRAGEPNGGLVENCAVHAGYDGKWVDNNCNIKNAYVCEVRIPFPCNSTVPNGKALFIGENTVKVQCNQLYMASHTNISHCYRTSRGFEYVPALARCFDGPGYTMKCFPGFSVSGSKCVGAFLDQPENYSGAVTACANKKYAKQATNLMSEKENSFIFQQLRILTTIIKPGIPGKPILPPSAERLFFIGLTKGLNPRGKSAWLWTEGETLYTNWASHQPEGGTGNCTAMSSLTGKWKAVDCNKPRGYVCQAILQYICLLPFIYNGKAVFTDPLKFKIECKLGDGALVGAKNITCKPSATGKRFYSPSLPVCMSYFPCPPTYTPFGSSSTVLETTTVTCNPGYTIFGSAVLTCKFSRDKNGSIVSAYDKPWPLCKDIDECRLRTHKCSPNATCRNIGGSYTCHCDRGYTGSGFQCTGVREPSVTTIPPR